MYKISLIESIMSAFENGVRNQSKNIMFIKYYNSFEVPEDNLNRIKSWGDVILVHHTFSRNDMQTAVQPFLDTIRDVYHNEFSKRFTAQEFVENCGVYSLQRQAITTYIETGVAYRHEEPIIVEISYETKRFFASIISMLNFISIYKKLIFIIDDIQYADYATLQLMNSLSDVQNTCNISILASYKESALIDSGSRDVWNELMEKASAENLIYDSGSNSEDVRKVKIIDEFMPVSSKADEYILKLTNMLRLLSLNQADYYLGRIAEEIDKENIKFKKQEYINLLAIYALCSIYLRNAGKSLQICEQMAAIIDEDDYVNQYRYYYLSALAQSLMLQREIAKKFVKKCISYAEKTGDENSIFKAKVLYYIVIYYSWVNIFYCDFNQTVPVEVLEELEQHGYINTLNYLMVFAFENDKETLEEIVSGKKPATYLNRAIKSGTKLDNREFLLGAYMKNIIICTEYGYSKYVAELYKKRIAIVKKEHNRQREGHMYNGLGYNCIIDEQYSQANTYLNEALKINFECDDAEKCAETLYNMALNCVAAGEYNSAIEDIELILKLMECLDISCLDICNIAKIYGFMALSQFYIGAYYNSYIYMDKMENALSHLLYCQGEPDYDGWDDEMFLYHFITGINYAKEKDYAKALQEYEVADFHKDRSVKTQFLTVTILAIEKAEAYRQLNEPQKAESVLKEAIDFCNSKGYFHKTRLLVKKIENSNEFLSKWNLPITALTKEQISKMIYNTRTRTELEKKTKEIGLLTTWQEIIGTNTSSVDKLVNTALMTLQNSYNLDGVIYVSIIENNLWYYTTDSDIKLDSTIANKIFDYFKTNSTAFVVNRGEKEFKDYGFFTDIIGQDKVATIIGVPVYTNEKLESIAIPFVNMHRNFTANKKRHHGDSLTILKFAFIQLRDAVEKTITRLELEKANDMLSKSSITDILTGTYNRQGLKKIISSEGINPAKNSITSVMYLDMDHFKYYNDAFGHQIGDEILKDFAIRSGELIDKKGYLVRYGGDEFVILLPGTDLEHSREFAKRFLVMFDEINERICQLIPDDSFIPEDKKLSCSIGISSFDSWDEDVVYAAFNQADEALYFVKRTTRNDYMLYTEIPKH